jgi:DNA-binding FrmR family transcriptional regulator
VQAVRGALREVNRLLVCHYLHDCLRAALADPDPAVREHALAGVLTLYRLAGADAPLWSGKEPL